MSTSVREEPSIPTNRTSRPEPTATDAGTHLVFLPDHAHAPFFLWGAPAVPAAFSDCATPDQALVIDETLNTRRVHGHSVAMLDALPRLAALTAAHAERCSASMAAWSQAAKIALDLVGRERLIPRIVQTANGTEARFGVALGHPEDAGRVRGLGKAFPPAAHAVPLQKELRSERNGRRHRRSAPVVEPAEVWAPEALLRNFLDAGADALVRAAMPRRARARSRRVRQAQGSWERRFIDALSGDDPSFGPDDFQKRTLLTELEAWARPALGAEAGAPRLCLQLDFPGSETGDEVLRRPSARQRRDVFPLRFFLQAAEDPSLLVPAIDVFKGRAAVVRRVARNVRAAEENLLRSLATAGRVFAPVARALSDARPDAVLLDVREAWTFLTEAASTLTEIGMGVILPAELTRSGQRRLRLRMRVGGAVPRTKASGAGAGGISLDALTDFRWEAELAGELLSESDLQALSRLKAPLVQYRGQWVAVDATELAEAQRLLAEGGGTLLRHEVLAAALRESARRPDVHLPIDVVTEGDLTQLLERLREGGSAQRTPVPPRFCGTLRPYQLRGLRWLVCMSELGFGACLADDMGLGKTIQLLAFLLHQHSSPSGPRGPTLLVCPTSVVGNWEREMARFSPTLPVIRHYGPQRARSVAEFQALPGNAVVITTYGLLRRDAELLCAFQWSVAALDEAQNIKNAASRSARAARALRADFRVALTGTPVENHLGELWSISEYLNPLLLGPLETFRREVAAPIERYGREDVAEKLRRVIRPFLLRRLKSDPAIIHDLPPKQEMKVFCTLTREQASLYQAALDEAMRRIESSQGIQRRGQVLALITALKQICNHPAHYLGERGPLANRSGKLQRLGEMLEEAIESGDRALIFTQFREMGERLVAELERLFGAEVPFLHGGVARAKRDAMVQRFQNDVRGPKIFVLSVKAGGTGLNLTAANHVFHFDRWWNPAVEDQATDRAHRIGQKRTVQVHKFLCAGTVEERVDRLLEGKRDLAARIVGHGEQWVTELDDAGLRELFSLAPDAVVAGDDADLEVDVETGPAAALRRRTGKRLTAAARRT